MATGWMFGIALFALAECLSDGGHLGPAVAVSIGLGATALYARNWRKQIKTEQRLAESKVDFKIEGVDLVSGPVSTK